MINTNNNVNMVMFAVPKVRKAKSGTEFTRLEAYTSLDELEKIVEHAKASGHTMVKALPRAYEKDNEQRLAIDITTFEGNTKK